MHFFDKLFNIRAHEWPRVSLLLLIAILTNVASIWGTTIAYVVFLKQAGIGGLPWVLVLSSVLSVLAVAIYTAFVDRVANDKLLVALYAMGAIGIGLGLALLLLGLRQVAYFTLYLLDLAWTAVFIAHFSTYVNGFYDIRAAKRILPVVSAGFRMGVVAAGLTMPLLTAWASPRTIVLIWLLTYVSIMVLIWFMPRLLKEGQKQDGRPDYTLSATAGSEKQLSSYISNIREGFRYVTQSTFLRWMATSVLLLQVLLALIEYTSSDILLTAYVNDASGKELASFLAMLRGVGSIVVLPTLLFVMSRLIARLGLGNAKLLFPAGNLMVCGGLIFDRGLVSASAAYIDRTAFRVAFLSPIDKLLYNAVPLRVRGRAHAFVSGFVAPVGSLMGGLLLLSPLISPTGFIWTLIGSLAVVYLVSAWLIRQRYAQALVKMLEQEDYSFMLSQEASDLSIVDPAMLDRLQKKLNESASHELTVFMAKLISQVGGNKAITILEGAARSAQDARTRSAILDVIVTGDLRGSVVRQLYTDFLTDPDGQVRQSAIAGLEELADSKDEQLVARMLEMVHDPDINVCVRALSTLVHTGDFYRFAPATQVLGQLLAHKDPQHRAYGVRVLGQIGGERAIRDLVGHLADAADQVRLETALALETLSQNTLPEQVKELVAEEMSHLLQDPVERVRQAALVVLSHIGVGSQGLYQAMVNALTDSSPVVRGLAVDALVQAGKSIIPIVHPRLDSPDLQLRKMATVVLARVDPKEFGSLIAGVNITGNLLTIYGNYGLIEALAPCTGYPSVAVLQSAILEQNQRLADEILYLLTALHDPGAIKIIGKNLHSETPRVRANAVEALESLTTPQMAHLIAPLFEPELPVFRLLSLGKHAWDIEHPNTARAIQQLATHPNDPWLRTIATFALGEIGAKGSRRQARRSPPPDLFAALTDTPVEDQDSPPQPQKQPAPGQIGLDLPGIEAMLQASLDDPVDQVRLAAQVAKRVISAGSLQIVQKEGILLSVIEKIIFLKEVPFFQGMTIDQLKVLANVCEEVLFEEDTRIFNQGDSGGVLYVVVNGRVGIEQEKRTGSFARLATIEAHSYFGEMNLFDNSPHSTSAVAIQDTLTLKLRREPLIALARQYPDLSLELINVLSQRLRETSHRIADLTRSRPRELHKLFDQLS